MSRLAEHGCRLPWGTWPSASFALRRSSPCIRPNDIGVTGGERVVHQVAPAIARLGGGRWPAPDATRYDKHAAREPALKQSSKPSCNSSLTITAKRASLFADVEQTDHA